ncbi:hypothetical protein GLOIN_2v1788267 [Rhizophagus irregularis DAOM 181602=DAOM 197198]|nr:hypothetical protein GLOIN_2v1788267 [Rhizophagus irregularis DAOM 181602=DAOM 197198]
MGSLKPVQNLPETSQTLSKYEDRPGQMETFLAYTNNNFSWPPSMPEYMRRYCFHQITGTGSNIDVQILVHIKETSDQVTSPIEVVSTTPGNPENLDDLISKELSSRQIQRPIQ